MDILNKESAIFMEFLKEYKELVNQKTLLEKGLEGVSAEAIITITNNEISKISNDIKTLENTELFTPDGVANIRVWANCK